MIRTGRTWKQVSDTERQLICEMYDSKKYKRISDISKKIHRAHSTITLLLQESGRLPQKKSVKGIQIEPIKGRSISVYHTLSNEEVKLLQACNNSSEFIESYFKTLGFGIRTATTLRDFWTKRKEITEYEKQKNAVKLIKKETVEKADGKVGSIPSVEELIINTNNLLAESIQLQKELVKVTSNQYQHFIEIQKKYEKAQEPPGTNRC